LTRGNPVGLTALLSHLNPQNGIFTGVACHEDDDLPVIGQVKCEEGRRNAHLTFILPEDAHQSRALPALLDGLAVEAGKWGALGVLADVNEHGSFFEVFRHAGFSVFGRQRIYEMPYHGSVDSDKTGLWRFASPEDEFSIRQLSQSLVPPLVQAADPLPSGRLYGLIHQEDGQTMAYVESIYGPDGIFLRPLIHPNVTNLQELLINLEPYLSPLLGRKVFLAVRSHHSWLESTMMEISDESTPRYALMVKYLAVAQKVFSTNAHRSVIDETLTERSTPPMAKKMPDPSK